MAERPTAALSGQGRRLCSAPPVSPWRVEVRIPHHQGWLGVGPRAGRSQQVPPAGEIAHREALQEEALRLIHQRAKGDEVQRTIRGDEEVAGGAQEGPQGAQHQLVEHAGRVAHAQAMRAPEVGAELLHSVVNVCRLAEVDPGGSPLGEQDIGDVACGTPVLGGRERRIDGELHQGALVPFRVTQSSFCIYATF